MLKLIFLLLPALLTIILYSYFVEPNWIEIRRIYLKGPQRIKIIHLSDLHLKKIGFREKRVIEIIKEESPDIILITGDLIEDERYKNILKKFTKRIEEYSYVFIVEGNHDPDLSFLESNKTFVLRNEVKRFGKYCIVGVPYYNPNFEKVFKNVSNCTVIFLAHSPEIIERIRGKAFLAFFGHTHGGQVKIPLIGPIYVPLPLKYWKYSEGFFYENGTFFYVSRGIGVWSKFPFRLFCRPEIVIFEILA